MIKIYFSLGLIFLLIYLAISPEDAPNTINNFPSPTTLLKCDNCTITPLSLKTQIDNPDSILELVNQEREKRGIDPLIQIKELTTPAQLRADEMFNTGEFSHDRFLDFRKNTDFQGPLGEDLAKGYYKDADIITAWINSSTHARVLFNPQYRYMGIGRSGTNLIGTLGSNKLVVLWLGGD